LGFSRWKKASAKRTEFARIGVTTFEFSLAKIAPKAAWTFALVSANFVDTLTTVLAHVFRFKIFTIIMVDTAVISLESMLTFTNTPCEKKIIKPTH